MFTDFFYTCKAKGLDISLSEWLTLMEALEKGLAGSSLTQFYYLARMILVKSETPPESPCIRCGACVRACPAKLMPFRIDEAMLQHRLEEAAAWHGDACISCGCCSYVCPAKRRLSVRTTAARRSIKGGTAK